MSSPPFAPPYKACIVTDGAATWVAVEPDGSQTPTAAPPSLTFTAAPEPVKANSTAKPGATMLQVPYAAKDEAKQLGARWDATRRSWYVPAGVDPAPFSRWMRASGH